MSQKNKTILISGGVTGIGAATALQFLEDGWQVAAFSNVKEHNQEFLKLAKMQGLAAKLLVLEADITKEKDLKKLVAETAKKFRTIDVLFNNAGMGYFIDADKMDVKKFDQMMEVNVIGMADLTKLVLPIMKKQKFGQIINNSSIAGKVGHAKSEFYAATKSAVMRYSEGLRAEVARFGIKVSVIYTSTVKTGFWSKKEYARRKKENWHGKTPVFLSPNDIAAAVWFVVNQPGYSVIEDITIMPFGN
jgi:NADP-dependent 3-hydroxy acid dehydrogenase YdfG